MKYDSPPLAYLVLCVIVTFALSISDTSMLGFGVLLLLLFVFAASLDKGSSDANLRALNWTNVNFSFALVTGILGGLLCLYIGSLIINYDKTASILVPDFSFAAASLTGAAVLPAYLTLFFNVLSQWFTVAPAEEAMARILGVRAGMTVFRNSALAYLFGSTLWILMHIPTYTAQNAPEEMYVVLGLISFVTITLLFLTKNIFSAIIAHGVFNTGVLMISSDSAFFVTGAIIVIVLSFTYFMTTKSKPKQERYYENI